MEVEVRAALWTGRRFGMKTAIVRRAIFMLALRAQRKVSHCRQWSIIGEVANDGEARATIGAIDKWIAMAAVCRVKQFAQTLIADGKIG